MRGGALSCRLVDPDGDERADHVHGVAVEVSLRVVVLRSLARSAKSFVAITTTAAAILQGHQNHGDDVIPSFDWVLPDSSGHFEGLNWSPNDAAFIANGCVGLPPLQG